MTIDHIITQLSRRQITSREQMVGEMLRVKLTAKRVGKRPGDAEKLYATMKAETEKTLGYFPADSEFFAQIYAEISPLDPVDFVCELYRGDRMGTSLSPRRLTAYLTQKIPDNGPCEVLITEAEKHLTDLKKCVAEHPQAHFTFTTQIPQMKLLMELIFESERPVEIVLESIYGRCLEGRKFDYILCLPAFGGKVEDPDSTFLTKEIDCVAYENMLLHLKENGVLEIIMPAKITFAGTGVSALRARTVQQYSLREIAVLPEGIFRPVTAIRTYLLTVENRKQGDVRVANLRLNGDQLEAKEEQTILRDHFLLLEDWRIELLLSDEDENIRRFNHSPIPKIKLKEVAEVFRGKSILKKNASVGNIAVLNISNIEDGEIDYSALDAIDEEERKVKRYELNDNDIVLSCRGTAIKSALFKAQEKTVIASSNVVIIRAGQKMLGGYIRLFLESPVGVALIKSFQRGTTIMNLNHTDIMEMELPMIPLEAQKELILRYNTELEQYRKTVLSAGKRLAETKQSLYEKFL